MALSVGLELVLIPPKATSLNPTYAQLADSALDMVVAGTSDAVLMVESRRKN